ncbi:prolyl oligopeptidase family serine peptidase [Amantichitinum ursilacus]|uniref:prolyl oligopeptidase n=1 Tax=Amantichitinum ursilacus TaxID=857265 RepID=A0A0N0GQY2_9NEIS|nr:prolyl oligopeptidase family serine peptidase [Amantichitinum ursilacus]KPC55300.1 Prolyl endopeptidase precursor [Amantichitinum ursilacus]
MSRSGWQRRDVLKMLGAIPVMTAYPWMAEAATGPRRPPVARVQPVTETLWGEKITDNYRWMENAADPDWEPFMRGQGAYTRKVLDAIPGRAALGKRLNALSSGAESISALNPSGGRVFYSKRPRNGDNFKLYVRDAAGGPEKLLLDPTVIKLEGSHVSLDWWVPSPDGKLVVYGMSPAGSENSVAQILEVDTGKLLPEKIDRTEYASPSWLPDSSGFFYNRLAKGPKPGDQDFFLNSAAWLHKLRTDPDKDQLILSQSQYAEIQFEAADFPAVAADVTSEYVIASPLGGVRPNNPWFSARLADVLAGKPQWRKICDVADDVTNIAQAGDDLYLLSTHGADNGQILKVSASAPDLAKAQVVQATSDVIIQSIAAARDGLYVTLMDGGYNSLQKIDKAGVSKAVPLPFEGSISSLGVATSEDGVWLLGSGWLTPFAVFHFDPAGNVASDTGICARPAIDLSVYEEIRTFATARDGTKVPLSIVARKGLKKDGKNPTLVDAYGSYQVVSQPYFSTRFIAFLEQGGVMATAGVRGGGEYGKRWWQAGKGLTKHNTWRDLIDCCEKLIQDGWTDNKHLAIQGGSAGGITVGRALTERPDLFAVVLSDVGASNTLRAEFSPNGPPNISEFGTIKEHDGFLALKEMDSIQAVKMGTRYPSVLLTTGLHDPRVSPWEVAKMTAALQRATASHNPVLLKVNIDAGHGIGSTRSQIDEELADQYAFVFWRTGKAGFQPR